MWKGVFLTLISFSATSKDWAGPLQKVFERTKEDFTDTGDPSVVTFKLLESQFKTNNGPQNAPKVYNHSQDIWDRL